MALLARLNELNAELGRLHLFFRDATIFPVSETPGVPLLQAHIAAALSRFCEIVDGLDELIEAEFGGHRIEFEAMQSATIH
ncbi:hypothetical protein [Azoarcus sp. KH32C]|uniref:T3SS (YopN, CesT) and YbjN peptide-binding chaperone 1 n=1 Tax=Azoarcus sp. KH32C TaxID=748247 RepID=UPI0002385FB7|nr:hypothetical protein [Azoarcus sp. KH32C]BAL23474.1 hypothetical protein AZKH_1145 [Azoarcus sp. KH32C]